MGFPVTWGEEREGDAGQKAGALGYNGISPQDLVCNGVTLNSNTVLYTWDLLRK